MNFRFAVFLLIIGCAVVWGSVSGLMADREAESTPQRISCADLGNKGPEQNTFIILTDFILSDGYVTKDSEVWIEVTPAGGDAVRVVAYTTEDGPVWIDAHTAGEDTIRGVIIRCHYSDLEHMSANPTLTGMVYNKVLSSDDEEALEELALNDPWVIYEGVSPSGPYRRYGAIVFGLLIAGFALRYIFLPEPS